MTFLDERPMTVEGRDRLFHKNAEDFFVCIEEWGLL